MAMAARVVRGSVFYIQVCFTSCLALIEISKRRSSVLSEQSLHTHATMQPHVVVSFKCELLIYTIVWPFASRHRSRCHCCCCHLTPETVNALSQQAGQALGQAESEREGKVE